MIRGKRTLRTNRAERLRRFEEVDIYPVTCERLSAGRSDLEVLAAVIRGGAKIVQLREKELDKRSCYQLAVRFREITADADILLIVNDHVDIALAVGADGVHLGQEDLPFQAARKIAPELIIGVSTHSLEEALRAQQGDVDYVNIGPIFPTSTKTEAKHFLGPEAIAEIGSRLKIPFTVMGGITEGNINQVVAAGANKIAMVSAITGAEDIECQVRKFREGYSSRWPMPCRH